MNYSDLPTILKRIKDPEPYVRFFNGMETQQAPYLQRLGGQVNVFLFDPLSQSEPSREQLDSSIDAIADLATIYQTVHGLSYGLGEVLQNSHFSTQPLFDLEVRVSQLKEDYNRDLATLGVDNKAAAELRLRISNELKLLYGQAKRYQDSVCGVLDMAAKQILNYGNGIRDNPILSNQSIVEYQQIVVNRLKTVYNNILSLLRYMYKNLDVPADTQAQLQHVRVALVTYAQCTNALTALNKLLDLTVVRTSKPETAKPDNWDTKELVPADCK